MAASAKRLPFKTLPSKQDLVDVGNEEIGILSIPRHYDLLAAEKIWVKEHLKNITSFQTEVVRFSEEIAAKEGKGIFDIYSGLTSGNTEILNKHLGVFLRLKEVQQETSSVEREIYATAILKFRIDPSWELEDTQNPDLIRPALVREIYEFAQKEQEGWGEPQPVTEEDIKKSPEESTDKK